MTIGDIKTFSLDDARSEANRLKSLVNQGIDPREEKRRLAMEAEAARQDRKLEKKGKNYLIRSCLFYGMNT